ncbi:putative delta-delta-dienoyl-CoA isomerase mitochondrial precursor [Podospora fimiseda]|uniref:Delta-delta-dienoyl-CoA isomerase mitochondrial n=1 Tax=Podospora fimiseda TaxID=252190 RepID=A0AAN6YRW3_9PEZI|nr:putative delta-delta-dienoyl-CoA isomerase mitochondrial precursor [Podospora fimiseda]
MASYSDFKYFTVNSPAPFVAHVEINRPTKLNAFIEAMWLELRQVFNRLSTDPEVRAVVLSGTGERAFSAGLDVTEAASENGVLSGADKLDGARKAAKLRRHIAEFQECISAVEKCEKPVICVLHGISIGLAIDIATCADVRFCTKETRFAVKEVDIGLAADIGSLARLPKVVGNLSWVKDVCLTARDFGAAEALTVGFVSQVHESKAAALAAAVKTASLIASKSPVAVQGTKEVLNHSRDHSVEENLRYVGVWNSAALQTTDLTAALLSGIQKKKPTFEKL